MFVLVACACWALHLMSNSQPIISLAILNCWADSPSMSVIQFTSLIQIRIEENINNPFGIVNYKKRIIVITDLYLAGTGRARCDREISVGHIQIWKMASLIICFAYDSSFSTWSWFSTWTLKISLIRQLFARKLKVYTSPASSTCQHEAIFTRKAAWKANQFKESPQQGLQL